MIVFICRHIAQKCLDSNEFLQAFLCCYRCINVVQLLSSAGAWYFRDHLDVGYVMEGLVVAMLACSSRQEPTMYKTS